MKRSFSCILALTCLLLLTACGKQGEATDPVDTPPALEKIAYAPEYHNIDLDCERVDTGYAVDGGIYLLEIHHRSDYGNSGSVVRMDPDGAMMEILFSDDCLDGAYGAVRPYALCAGEDDTFWLLLDCSPRPEEVDQIVRGTFLCQYDSQGTELARLEVTDALSEARLDASSVRSVQLDAGSWLYLYGNGKVWALDGQQQLQFSLPCETMSYQCCVMLPDGRPTALVWEAKGPGEPQVYELRTIDREAQDWGEVYPIHSDRCYQVFPGSGRYLFFWNSGSAIWGWNKETGTGELVLDQSNVDMNLDANLLRCFAALEDGRLAAVTWDNDRGELAVLTPTDPSELPEKTVLTLACVVCPSRLQWYVTEFNKASQNYRIEIKEYITASNLIADGIQRMAVDITAGNVPDLLCMNGLSADKFGTKGILEDLWPYIDGDPELSREDLMTHVLECAEVDGRLYEIFNSFAIKTVAGAAEVVGNRLSWTVADLQAALESMPEGASAYGSWETANLLLRELVNTNMSSYVDWTAGTCSFDSQEFKDLLSYVGDLGLPVGQRGEACEWVEFLVMDKQQMLYTANYGEGLTNFQDIQLCESLFGGPVSFVGHPRLDGACGSSFYIGSESAPIAMTTSCKDKEGAWSFLRELLLPQESLPKTTEQLGRTYILFAFPINRHDFEALAQLSMTEMEVRIGRGFSDGSGNYFSVTFDPLTQAEYDQIMELYNAIDSLYAEDTDVMDAVLSEAAVYFSGDIGLDEAASRIQKRVQLYLDEQR